MRLTYEVIRDDEGSEYQLIKNNKWVTKPELSPFTGAINDQDIDGPELHVKKANPNSNYSPEMNLVEAKNFLTEKLLKPWLVKKREMYKVAEGHAIAKHLANK